MIINIDVPEDKEFFRVKNILDKLRESPDYKKDRIILLSNMATDLLRDITLTTDINNIKAYRFSGTKVITATMNEADVVKESLRAVEEQFNVDVAIENLSALVRFWKASSNEKDVYKPLLQEVISILQETQVYLQETKEVDGLKEIIKGKEQMVSSLQSEQEGLVKTLNAERLKAKRWQESIQPLLNNLNIIKAVAEFKAESNPLTAPLLNNFTDVMVHLITEGGRDTLSNVAESLNVTTALIIEIQRNYTEFLELNPTKTMIGIIKDPKYSFNVNKYLEELEKKKDDEIEEEQEDAEEDDEDEDENEDDDEADEEEEPKKSSSAEYQRIKSHTSKVKEKGGSDGKKVPPAKVNKRKA